MKLYVGTSGYSYKEWKGSFYPEDLPDKSMLHFYARHFKTVEINNTFYRMPKTPMLQGWAADVPAGFRFVLKAPQRITHRQRLNDVDDSVSYFLETSQILKQRLGALLFQLPPNMKKDVTRLREFLALLPPKRHVAIEFRHPSWFDDEVFTVLHDSNAAMCIAETEDGVDAPIVATTNWGYLRLRRRYNDAQLKQWVKQVCEQKWQNAFIFFKHEESGTGPEYAQRFIELAE